MTELLTKIMKMKMKKNFLKQKWIISMDINYQKKNYIVEQQNNFNKK